MLRHTSFVVLLTAVLGALPSSAGGLYTSKSPVVQVNAKNYDQLVVRSNYVSIIEFYAPWCGHCQNLKPAYEKAAKSLEGLAKVVAINCDDEESRSLCTAMRIEGFPTLRMSVPSDTPGKPRHEDYQGPRTAKAIVDFVLGKIPNHVKRVTDKDIESWLKKSNESAKAILFTNKGTTSPLLKAIAIDFMGKIQIGQVRDKETAVVGQFGITKFPSLVLLPGSEKSSILYEGEFKKKPMVEFLTQVAEPNQDPPPSSAKPKKSAAKKAKKSSETKKSTTAPESSEGPEPSESPQDDEPEKPKEKPAQKKTKPQLLLLGTSMDARSTCLSSKTGTCVLALAPVEESQNDTPPVGALQALDSLAQIQHKHSVRQSHLFPMYLVLDNIKEVSNMRSKLGLGTGSFEIIAINCKRGWWRRYDYADGAKAGVVEIEKWIDEIRMGDGKKEYIPEGVIPSDDTPAGDEMPVNQKVSPEQESKQEPEAPPLATPGTDGEQDTEAPKAKTAVHEEL